MPDPRWEDSLNVLDLRNLFYIELVERFASNHTREYLRCRIGQCRRHRLCMGPMAPLDGHLPLPFCQCGPKGIRLPCRRRFQPFTLDDILDMGPKLAVMAGEENHGLTFSGRIKARRDARRSQERKRGLQPGELTEILSPALRAGLFKFVERW